MLRKLAEEKLPCTSPDHEPPSHIVLESGIYEHICSSCGHKVVFTVKSFYC